jgi:hypothetical protein
LLQRPDQVPFTPFNVAINDSEVIPTNHRNRRISFKKNSNDKVNIQERKKSVRFGGESSPDNPISIQIQNAQNKENSDNISIP